MQDIDKERGTSWWRQMRMNRGLITLGFRNVQLLTVR